MRWDKEVFGPVSVASGTLNFFGEGWPQHKYYRHVPGFDFTGATFVAKTITLEERMPTPETKGQGKGNMVISWFTRQPTEFPPDCVRVNFITGDTANSVGLVNFGAKLSFETGLWQKRKEPFQLSYMPVGKTKEERLSETREYVSIAKDHLPDFLAPVAQQYNDTCPNTGHCSIELSRERLEHLEILAMLDIPLVTKFDSLTSAKTIKEVVDSGLCSWIVIPNSLKYGSFPDRIEWKRYRKIVEPLVKKYGACGLSARINFVLAKAIIFEARNLGVNIPIDCGGVSCKQDVREVKAVGGSGIEFGRISITRPHRIQGIIKEAHRIFK